MIKRVCFSLIKINCGRRRDDVRFKVCTLYNLLAKALMILGFKLDWAIWKYRDCEADVSYGDLTFRFYCPKNSSLNIYMNPYFHEYDISQFIYGTLKEGDCFIDVGSMGGLYTILSSKLVGGTGRVLSVEPNPVNFKTLKRNTMLNALENTELHNMALGEANREVDIFWTNGAEELTSILKQKQTEKELNIAKVEMTTLDTLTAKIDKIKIIKIDTEGYDEKILNGATQTLRKTDHVIIEANTPSIRTTLEQKGFDTETMKPSGYLLATKHKN